MHNVVEGLHLQHLIGSDLTGLFLRPLGETALKRESFREPRRLTKIRIWHDPYSDTLFYGEKDSFIDQKGLERQSLRRLPTAGALDPSVFEERFKNIQKVLIESQQEYERDLNIVFTGHVDVLQAKATPPEVIFRTARLLVLSHPRDGNIEWLIIRGHGESAIADEVITDQLKQLEAEGHLIVPGQDLPEDFVRSEKESPLASSISEGVEVLKSELPDTYDFISTHQHRGVMLEAVRAAEKELIIISPWLNTNAVDAQLIREFDRALKKHPGLHIRIGYGYEPTAARETKKLQAEGVVLGKLETLSRRYEKRISVLDLGRTHQKILIADDKIAVITSYNWLSFMPRPNSPRLYMREETGTVFRRRKAVEKLKDVIKDVYTPVRKAGTPLG